MILRHLALSLLIVVTTSTSADAQGTLSPLTPHKVLRGEVADNGIFTEELQAKLGIGVARVKGKLVVALVMDGMGKSAGLKEGDAVLDARTENNVVSLKIDRGGTIFERRVDLATGRKLTAATSASGVGARRADTATGTIRGGVRFKKYAGMLQFGDGYFGPRDRDGNLWPGWTPQDVQDTQVWANEFRRNDIDGPLMGAWAAKVTKARILATDYVQKYWPDSVIGWRSYHLVVDRAGNVIRYFQDPDNALNWADNDAEWNRLARGLIEGLSQSHVLACPPGSKVERFQTGVDIEVFHDPEKRY